MVVTRKGTSRWDRGIKRPDEIKLAALAALLERDPGMNRATLCARTGIARSTLPYYLRHIRDSVAEAAVKNEEARHLVALTHVDLVARMNLTAAEVRADLERLRASKSGANSAVVFSGVKALVAVERLVAELLGAVKPPSQDVYNVRVAAIFNKEIPTTALSEVAQVTLSGRELDASNR